MCSFFSQFVDFFSIFYVEIFNMTKSTLPLCHPEGRKESPKTLKTWDSSATPQNDNLRKYTLSSWNTVSYNTSCVFLFMELK